MQKNGFDFPHGSHGIVQHFHKRNIFVVILHISVQNILGSLQLWWNPSKFYSTECYQRVPSPNETPKNLFFFLRVYKHIGLDPTIDMEASASLLLLTSFASALLYRFWVCDVIMTSFAVVKSSEKMERHRCIIQGQN